jgi:hypothetical protein
MTDISRCTSWDRTGLQHVSWDGQTAHGVIIDGDGGLSYQITVGPDRHTRTVSILTAQSSTMDLIAQKPGQWITPDGSQLPHLQGCLEPDISATPFTNTLAISRQTSTHFVSMRPPCRPDAPPSATPVLVRIAIFIRDFELGSQQCWSWMIGTLPLITRTSFGAWIR